MYRSPRRLARTSWMATMSKFETISAMQATSNAARRGVSSAAESHLSFMSPNARTFQVPIRRF